MATAFDTMWAIMLALKEASIELQTTATSLEYNTNDFIGADVVTSTIESKLLDVSFEGLTVIHRMQIWRTTRSAPGTSLMKARLVEL